MKLLAWLGLLILGVLLFAEVAVDGPIPAFLIEKKGTLLFTGDLMFDRYIRTASERFGEDSILSNVDQLLTSADLTAGNLEGPVTAFPSVSVGTKVGSTTNMQFTFKDSIPALLARHGFDLVSIGNNHILDFGRVGATETKALLEKAGISYIGDPLREAPDIVVKSAGGIRVAFLAYNDFVGLDPEDVRQGIRVARENFDPDVVVVMTHWGIEYVPEPPERIEALGRSFIDAGADLVIGTHPHVVEPFEDYNGGRIYYSLGNFVFDQYWDESVRCGEVVRVTITKKEKTLLSYEEIPVELTLDGSTRVGCGS